MKSAVKGTPTKHRFGTTASSLERDESVRRADKTADPYEDNDLGAEWPGNLAGRDLDDEHRFRKGRKRE
jgi:hypothetical protein